MENQTFRTRLADLMQKSRKALRLYTSMGTSTQSELGEVQAQQWKEVNADLLKQVSQALGAPNSRVLAADIFCLRDRFHSTWRLAETEVHQKQRELISSSENGDFIKAAILARELVLLKAREQASQAAHHELQEVLTRSRIQPPTIELSTDKVVGELAEDNGRDVLEAKPRAKIFSLAQRSRVA